MSGSVSAPSENPNHDTAALIERHFRHLKDLKPRDFISTIWLGYEDRGKLAWSTETIIEGFVKLVMKDALRAIDLIKQVCIENNLGIFGLQSDPLWVLLGNGIPIGVFEVKKPDKNVMSSQRLHGQILDNMLQLRNFFGQKHVFWDNNYLQRVAYLFA